MSLGGFSSTMHAICYSKNQLPLPSLNTQGCVCRGSPSTSLLVSDSWRTSEVVEFWTFATISSSLRACYSWIWDSSQSLCRRMWEIPQTLLPSLMQRPGQCGNNPLCIHTGPSAVYGPKVTRSTDPIVWNHLAKLIFFSFFFFFNHHDPKNKLSCQKEFRDTSDL